MWRGYLVLGGDEIVNNTRTVQYAANAGLSWFSPRKSGYSVDMPMLLGDGERYTTPLQDAAPWVDENNPHSWEFLGFYCMGAEGFENSSRTAETIEYITTGGVVGRIRHATLSGVINGILIATTNEGAEYGMAWLRQATLGGPCANSESPFGVDLCYLSAQPRLATEVNVTPGVETEDGGDADDDIDYIEDGGGSGGGGLLEDGGDAGTPASTPTVTDLRDCLIPYRRTLRKVKVPGGPEVIAEKAVSTGACWQVQFTAVAGVPWRFAAEVDVINDFLTGTWSGIAEDVDPDGYVVANENCTEPLYAPLFDPLCPPFSAPPAPPNVPLNCFQLPSSWRRRSFKIPASVMPTWTSMAPIITISTGAHEVRMTRLRFYSAPELPGDPTVDPCSFCGDLVISYLPPNSSMIIDAAAEVVAVEQPGGVLRAADSLVYGSDGKPFTWPDLSCGFAYIVTVDSLLSTGTDLATIDLTLMPRSA